MEHEHSHHHHEVSGKNLFITIILNIIITIAQIIGGIFSGSLALISDALHNFSDVVALVLAYWTNKIAKRESSEQKTFGYKRAEILVTLFNASVLIAIAIYLMIESISKFFNPQDIDSLIVVYLGILSIVLNSASVLLIKDDSNNNMNIKAAYLHLLSDVMTSVAVVIGGLLMCFYHIYWVDPIISILIAVYLVKASYSLVFESIDILMQSTPKDLHVKDIKNLVEKEDCIENIHHLHIWKLNDKEIHLEAHLDFKENILLEESTKIVENIEQNLIKTFGITHVTLQSEFNRNDKKTLIS